MTDKKLALAFDLGGTKVSVGLVDRGGKVVDNQRVKIDLSNGPSGLVNQLADLGKAWIEKSPQGILPHVGLASAGPLDPTRGVWLDPTNLLGSNGAGFGEFAIAQELERALGRDVLLENDAAAAVLAEHWIGSGKKVDDLMILTLGTGLGVGTLVSGELVRSGRGLHPEAGHIILSSHDKENQCACGAMGCAEAFLSGSHFSRRFGTGASALEITELARKGDTTALAHFEDYAKWFASAIASFVVLYAPQKIVLAGSFANAAEFFVPPAKKLLEKLLERRRVGVDLYPSIKISTLNNEAGLVGAARIAWLRETKL